MDISEITLQELKFKCSPKLFHHLVALQERLGSSLHHGQVAHKNPRSSSRLQSVSSSAPNTFLWCTIDGLATETQCDK